MSRNRFICLMILIILATDVSKTAGLVSAKLIDLSIFIKSMNLKLPETVLFYPETSTDTSALSLSNKKHICEVVRLDRQRPNWPFVYQPKHYQIFR